MRPGRRSRAVERRPSRNGTSRSKLRLAMDRVAGLREPAQRRTAGRMHVAGERLAAGVLSVLRDSGLAGRVETGESSENPRWPREIAMAGRRSVELSFRRFARGLSGAGPAHREALGAATLRLFEEPGGQIPEPGLTAREGRWRLGACDIWPDRDARKPGLPGRCDRRTPAGGNAGGARDGSQRRWTEQEPDQNAQQRGQAEPGARARVAVRACHRPSA
jgi:hypothetical protein